MTETRATPVAEPVFPPGRYGRRRAPRRRRRWVTVVVALVVLVAAAAISIRLYRQYGVPDYQPTVRRQFDVSDTGVSIEFEVHKPADREATCHLRALARTGEQVGSADVVAPAGDPAVVTYHLPTSKRPVLAEVVRCDPKP
jgi:Domain of unknown function (DUF4307)